ncbi:MAG: glutaredoxin family protein [Chloroflexota bacterium]|nr:glutaredoxin family protein [Chloroflexota bacterium]
MAVSVILYSKPDCHLCEDAKEKLARLSARGYQLNVREQDITADPELFQRFRYVIPVVEVQGQTLQAPISEYKLERLISNVAASA